SEHVRFPPGRNHRPAVEAGSMNGLAARAEARVAKGVYGRLASGSQGPVGLAIPIPRSPKRNEFGRTPAVSGKPWMASETSLPLTRDEHYELGRELWAVSAR